MSLRLRLLLAFGSIVAVAVAAVSYAVSAGARGAFERFDKQRTLAVIGQFQREFQLEGSTLALRAAAIARVPQVREMAAAMSRPNADPAPYLELAGSLAQEQQLDFLELLTSDGTIISSAQWPARFGLKEPWISSSSANEKAFLRYEETPEGSHLAQLAVRTVEARQTFYVVAGRRIDSRFLNSLVLPEGTKVLLWQRPPGSTSGELIDAAGAVAPGTELRSLIGDVQAPADELTRRIRLSDGDAEAYVAHTIPLTGVGSTQPIAILIVASDRQQLGDLQSRIRTTGWIAGFAGLALAILASSWWAARISKPLETLSTAAGDVATGEWERKVQEQPGAAAEIATLVASFNHMTDELLRQRDRAVQAERVAAWRELARRLAHELKNPLFPLQITVENLIKARERNSPEFAEIFAESTTTLLAELANLKKIVGRFSDFSKMPAPHLQRVELNGLMNEVAKLFGPQLAAAAKPIHLRSRFAANDSNIDGDPDLLRRAFENLVLNAIDAMPEGGTLMLSTSDTHDAVTVTISDTGAGLTEEEASRLFTPYYTTKRHGTGLGLAIVQSVISDHGARISVSSRPGAGATFTMEFQKQPAEAAVPAANA